MTIKTSSASYQNAHMYQILGDLSVNIRVQENPYNLPLETLFAMAARQNKKRGFLFVSRLLGKHMPVHPALPLLSSRLLAHRLMQQISGRDPKHTDVLAEAIQAKAQPGAVYQLVQEEVLSLNEPAFFIGFAETATALAHGLYDCFDNVEYIHTTREQLLDLEPVISFEEEHSHAVSHRCYARDAAMFQTDCPIVLIDDEMTTGKTTVNIIKSIQQTYPRKVYYVASLLDWRSEQDQALFDELMDTYDITIKSVSLLKGTIEVKGEPKAGESLEHYKTSNDIRITHHTVKTPFESLPYTSINEAGQKNTAGYLPLTGRFGLARADRIDILNAAEEIGEQLQPLRSGSKTLCLGTGEFMHFPMSVAVHMGDGISYQSTTRSPIHAEDREDYAVKQKLCFDGPTDPSVMNYVYNIPAGHYDEIFLFMERKEQPENLDSLLQALSGTGIKELQVITFA